MSDATPWPSLAAIYADASAPGPDACPVWLADAKTWADAQNLTPAQRQWLALQNFAPAARRAVLVPGGAGEIAGIALGCEPGRDAMLRAEAVLGLVPAMAPTGTYRIAGSLAQPELAAVAWGLGAYRYRRYKSAAGDTAPKLQIPANANAARVKSIVEAVHFGRDLINTPASDMGPAELEAAARTLAARHGATVTSIVGEALLAHNFPMIHAVGRASPRAPRLIDLRWGDAGPRVTLVGKGVCFDTGGLDLKPASGMLLMKKDMGGAAAVLALGHMLMAAKRPMRLRILIAAAENSVSGDAFRPGDVLTSRAGLTVEIGNTDAEGRLVLADAMTYADEDKPDTLITMATLTGAARTAMGPEVAPFYCDDDEFAARLQSAGDAVADPLWRLPFWTSYEGMLDSPIADLNNVSESPFAGSIVAALFLRKFVKQAKRYAHFDIFGWRPTAKALGPRGGEVHAARALFEALRTE